MRSPIHILYHIIVIVLSALAALSLPHTANFLAMKFLVLWSLIENERLFLISIEIAFAMLLILFLNYIGKSWNDRKLVNAAKRAGLFFATSRKVLFIPKRLKRMKEKQAIAKDVMVIGSTGFRTFGDPGRDLHAVIKNCREAKIMLLNPFSEGADLRATSIPDPDVTKDHFREQIKKSISFLKGLNKVRKNVTLKLYNDMPFLKLNILGDFIWVQHYHTGLDVRVMPEYVFENGQNYSGFYDLFYQYFLRRWKNPEMPEYDFDSDELIYRDKIGNEIKREKFNKL